MSQDLQEFLALAIVGMVVVNILRKIVLAFFRPQIARFFLKRGKIKWAMKINRGRPAH